MYLPPGFQNQQIRRTPSYAGFQLFSICMLSLAWPYDNFLYLVFMFSIFELLIFECLRFGIFLEYLEGQFPSEVIHSSFHCKQLTNATVFPIYAYELIVHDLGSFNPQSLRLPPVNKVGVNVK